MTLSSRISYYFKKLLTKIERQMNKWVDSSVIKGKGEIRHSTCLVLNQEDSILELQGSPPSWGLLTNTHSFSGSQRGAEEHP